MKKIVIVILLLVSIGGTYSYPNLSSTLNIATGFSAKNLCSGHFISGFDTDAIATEALHPIDSSFQYLSYEVDENKQEVQTSIAGFFVRKAVYRPGTGCTLLVAGEDTLSPGVTPLEPALAPTTEPWPRGLGEISGQKAGVDYARLNSAIDQAFSEPEQSGKRNVKAISIVHQGNLIAERYANGVDKQTPLLSWSMAKSITNLHVGLLVKAGKLNLFDAAEVPLWQDSQDPRSKITLDQLLRMSSGLEFNETYGINTDVSSMLSTKGDTAAFASNKPLAFAPDSHWSYSSGTSNIIAGIIKRAVGGNFQDYYEFNQQQLLQPLGINSAIFETDASNTFVGSSYFYATARDWAKLGQLMLQNGSWNNQQLLPENWVEYSTTPTKTHPLNEYGAQFWLNAQPLIADAPRTWPSVPEDTYYMGGYQGQYVIVVPSKELVIVRLGFTHPGTDRGIEALISGSIDALPL